MEKAWEGNGWRKMPLLAKLLKRPSLNLVLGWNTGLSRQPRPRTPQAHSPGEGRGEATLGRKRTGIQASFQDGEAGDGEPDSVLGKGVTEELLKEEIIGLTPRGESHLHLGCPLLQNGAKVTVDF